MSAPRTNVQFNPVLWQNVNLDDPKQTREFDRQLIYYLIGLQARDVQMGALIATMQGQIATLQSQVATLQSQVATLQGYYEWTYPGGSP